MALSKCHWYIAFMAIGILITTANLVIYAHIGIGGATGKLHHRDVVSHNDVDTSRRHHATSVPHGQHRRHHSDVETGAPPTEARHHKHHRDVDTAAPVPDLAVKKHPEESKKAKKGKHHHEDAAMDDSKKKSHASTPKRKHKYVASELDKSLVNMSFDESLDIYHKYLQDATEEIEQSSRKFKDIEERSDSGVGLPTHAEELLDRYGVVLDATHGVIPTAPQTESEAAAAVYCDPRNADYTPSTDDACTRYLSSIQNMRSIKPMSSILSSGRTIKFKVYYKHHNITAVLKVSQKKFALEPASEVIAMRVDRWMGFQRVPPVTWTPVPIDFLRAGAATMDAFYVQWFDKFVLHYDTARALTSTCFVHTNDASSKGDDGREEHHKCLNVSLQLWMADVRNAEETILKPSEAYRKYLELPPPSDDAVILQRLQKYLPGGDGKKEKKINPKYLALSELMDEFVFDLVIGNTDRWFGHNSFALGGCVDGAPCERTQDVDIHHGKLPSKSTMRLAFIDQGSSFYRKGAPEMNPFATDFEKLCRFPFRTATKILQLMPEGTTEEEGAKLFHDALRPKIPSGIFGIHNVGLFKAAGSRLAGLATHIRHCLQKHNRSDVLYFEPLV